MRDLRTLVMLFWRVLLVVCRHVFFGLGQAYRRWQQKIAQPRPLTKYAFMPASWVGHVSWRAYVAGLCAVWLVLFVSDAPMHALISDVDPAIRRLFVALTNWGRSEWFLVPSGLYFLALCAMAVAAKTLFFKTLYVHSSAILGAVFLSVALSGIAVQLLKAIFGRLRPGRAESLEGFNFYPFSFDSAYTSMPSGHATTAFSFAIMICFLLPRLKWLFGMIAFLIIVSRVVVSAYYPSDVYLGALLGTACAVIVRHMMANRNLVFSHHSAPPSRRANQSLSAWIKALAKRLEMRFLACTEPINLTQNETKS